MRPHPALDALAPRLSPPSPSPQQRHTQNDNHHDNTDAPERDNAWRATCRGWMLLSLCVLWLLSPVSAWALPTPSQGVTLPWGSTADLDRPSALLLNPAGLSFQPSWGIQYLHTGLRLPWHGTENRGPAALQGNGDALFFGAKLLPFLGIGAGLQWLYLDPPDANGKQIGGHLRMSVGGALKLGKWFGVGFGVNAFVGSLPEFQSLFGIDLGLTLRPWNFLSFGLTAQNVNAPYFGQEQIGRTWRFGLAIRPLLHDRLVLSADVQLDEQLSDTIFQYRVEFEPLNGLILGANVRHHLPNRGLTIGTFVELRFGRWGIGAVGLAGVGINGQGQNGFRNLSASLWYSGTPYRPIVRLRGRLPLLDLGGALPERDLSLSLNAGRPTFLRIILALQRMTDDPKVSGLMLRLGSLQCGLAKLQELREALKRFKAKGKTLIVYAASLNLKAYYLASVAHHIFVNPAGNVWLGGLSAQHIFLAGLFENLGVKAQFVKFGKFKTAPNTYTEKTYTPAHRAATKALLDDLYGQIVDGIAKARKKKPTDVKAWFKHGLHSPKEAKQSGLIDDFFYWDQIEGKLKKHVKRVLWFDPGYLHRKTVAERWHGYPQIAVIYVDGPIVSGNNLDDPIFGTHLSGAQTLVRHLSRAMYNSNIKAVVLRVDSPGGEVLAADLIWRYVWMLRRTKPVIVSMGSVAASGGYYVAAPAHEIVASPATITGSIGIFAGKFDFSGLLEKLGANVQIQKRGPMADLFSPYRSFSKHQQTQLRKSIYSSYLQFLQKVASGRGMKLKDVKPLAAGRVWTGQQAIKVKLIDHYGGLWKAIQRARIRANIDPKAKIEYVAYPSFPSWRISLSRLPSLSIKKQSPKTPLIQALQQYKQLFSRLQSPKMWALQPYLVHVK